VGSRAITLDAHIALLTNGVPLLVFVLHVQQAKPTPLITWAVSAPLGSMSRLLAAHVLADMPTTSRMVVAMIVVLVSLSQTEQTAIVLLVMDFWLVRFQDVNHVTTMDWATTYLALGMWVICPAKIAPRSPTPYHILLVVLGIHADVWVDIIGIPALPRALLVCKFLDVTWKVVLVPIVLLAQTVVLVGSRAALSATSVRLEATNTTTFVIPVERVQAVQRDLVTQITAHALWVNISVPLLLVWASLSPALSVLFPHSALLLFVILLPAISQSICYVKPVTTLISTKLEFVSLVDLDCLLIKSTTLATL